MASVAAEGRRPGRHRSLGVWAAWLLLGVAVFLLALLFPPSGDDWRRIAFADHTVSGYLERSRRFYLEHNGRVLPNVLSFMLMDPWWLRALAKAVTVVGLVAALRRVVGSRSMWGVVPALLGVLLVPAPVLRQVLAWSTGFFYYVPPMVGLVLLIGTLAGRWPGGVGVGHRWWMLAGTALLGAATCLFLEPVTLATVGVAVGGVLVTLLRRRRPSWALTGWAVGSLAGAAVMLTSPGLRHSLAGENDYYGTAGEGLVGTVVMNYSLISRSFVLTSVSVLGLVLLGALAQGVRASRHGRPVTGRLLITGALLIGLYAVPRRLLLTGRLTCTEPALAGCDLPVLALDLAMLVLLLAVVVVSGLLATASAPAGVEGPAATRAGQDRTAWVALLAATLLLLAPLLLVVPIGPRNLYGPLVTLTGMAMLTLRPWVDGPRPEGTARDHGPAAAVDRREVVLVRAGLATVAAAGIVLVGVISWSNARVFAERVDLMEEAVAEGHDEVELPPYPYPRWVHGPDDDKMGYRYFHDHHYDIVIRFAEP